MGQPVYATQECDLLNADDNVIGIQQAAADRHASEIASA